MPQIEPKGSLRQAISSRIASLREALMGRPLTVEEKQQLSAFAKRLPLDDLRVHEMRLTGLLGDAVTFPTLSSRHIFVNPASQGNPSETLRHEATHFLQQQQGIPSAAFRTHMSGSPDASAYYLPNLRGVQNVTSLNREQQGEVMAQYNPSATVNDPDIVRLANQLMSYQKK